MKVHKEIVTETFSNLVWSLFDWLPLLQVDSVGHHLYGRKRKRQATQTVIMDYHPTIPPALKLKTKKNVS